MGRGAKRVLIAGLVLAALVAFLLVKLAPSRGGPPIRVHVEGQDQRLTRSTLVTALKKLFPKGNGEWKLMPQPADDPAGGCVLLSAGYRSASGRAVTAPYLFARWLEARIAAYTYPDAAAAGRASDAPGAYQAEGCEAKGVAAGLRREGYVVGKPHAFPLEKVQMGDYAASRRIEIPTRYKGRSYKWDYDSTSVRKGRTILVLGTATAGPFLKQNQALARELAAP